MENILLTGANGQVGWELQRSLGNLGRVFAFGREEFDLSNASQMIEQIERISPSIIVNAGAYTAVDRAESEPELAMQVNGQAPGILAEAAKRLNALLIHFSTDYVFDGQHTHPYTEEDSVNPLNVYGKSKLQGELNIQAVGCRHLILRTSWVYGLYGQNFLTNLLKLAQVHPELKMTSDQWGCPTWSRQLAIATSQLIAILLHEKGSEHLEGLYHLTASGKATRHGLAEAIFAGHSVKPLISAVSSDYFKVAAKRPLYSVLCNRKLEKAFGIAMPDWPESLKLCLDENRAWFK